MLTCTEDNCFSRAFVQSMFHGSFFGIASAQTGIRVYAGYPHEIQIGA